MVSHDCSLVFFSAISIKTRTVLCGSFKKNTIASSGAGYFKKKSSRARTWTRALQNLAATEMDVSNGKKKEKKDYTPRTVVTGGSDGPSKHLVFGHSLHCQGPGPVTSQTGPVRPIPVWAGIKPAQIQNLNLNLKK